MSMGQVAESLDISVASATGIVDRMETRGLVERRRDADDRRVVLVVPAAGARAVLTDIDTRRRKALTLVLSMLTDEELDGLLNGHRALRAARVSFAKTMGTAAARPNPAAAK